MRVKLISDVYTTVYLCYLCRLRLSYGSARLVDSTIVLPRLSSPRVTCPLLVDCDCAFVSRLSQLERWSASKHRWIAPRRTVLSVPVGHPVRQTALHKRDGERLRRSAPLLQGSTDRLVPRRRRQQVPTRCACSTLHAKLRAGVEVPGSMLVLL